MRKLVLARGDFMLVRRVDHLAVHTSVYIRHQHLPAYVHRLVAAEIFNFNFHCQLDTHSLC